MILRRHWWRTIMCDRRVSWLETIQEMFPNNTILPKNDLHNEIKMVTLSPTNEYGSFPDCKYQLFFIYIYILYFYHNVSKVSNIICPQNHGNGAWSHQRDGLTHCTAVQDRLCVLLHGQRCQPRLIERERERERERESTYEYYIAPCSDIIATIKVSRDVHKCMMYNDHCKVRICFK